MAATLVVAIIATSTVSPASATVKFREEPNRHGCPTLGENNQNGENDEGEPQKCFGGWTQGTDDSPDEPD